MQPQPGTRGTWGLGPELFVESEAGGRVVGHSGGAPPARGAMLRVDPATRGAFILRVSGGVGTLNSLVHDWTYWATGRVSEDARRQIVQDRSAPAAVTIQLGSIAIAAWWLVSCRRARGLLGGTAPVAR